MTHARTALGGEFPGESWEQAQTRWIAQAETSQAIADGRADRGQWLTEDERRMLTHLSRIGPDGYPICRVGRQWSYDWPRAPLYRTRRQAHCAFQVLAGSWDRLESREYLMRATAQEGW